MPVPEAPRGLGDEALMRRHSFQQRLDLGPEFLRLLSELEVFFQIPARGCGEPFLPATHVDSSPRRTPPQERRENLDLKVEVKSIAFLRSRLIHIVLAYLQPGGDV